MSLLEPVIGDAATTERSGPETDVAPRGEGMPFNVVVLYETAASARRAVGMVSRLVTLSDSEFAMQPILWRLDLLAYPSLEHAAATDVRAADLLVLATEETQTLPAEAKRWLDGCFEHCRSDRPATVGLFGPDDDWSILS